MAQLQKDRLKVPGTAVIHKPNKILIAVKDGVTNYSNYFCYHDNKCRRCPKLWIFVVAAALSTAIVYAFYHVGVLRIDKHLNFLPVKSEPTQAGPVNKYIVKPIQDNMPQIPFVSLTSPKAKAAAIGEVSPPLPKNVLHMMNRTELYHYYKGLISLLTYRCNNRVPFGNRLNIGDPGKRDHVTRWMVCQDMLVALRKADCLVYSFGMEWHCDQYDFKHLPRARDQYLSRLNWNFEFEEELASTLGCDVYSYDPSHGDGTAERRRNGYFYPIALEGTRENAGASWRIKSLSEILDRNGHADEDIDLLKLDLDGSEWDVLDNMIENDHPFKRVRQLALGVNLYKNEVTGEQLRDKIVLLETLTKIGMRLYDVQDLGSGRYYNSRVKHNMTCCSTLHFVNVRHRSLL